MTDKGETGWNGERPADDVPGRGDDKKQNEGRGRRVQKATRGEGLSRNGPSH